MASEPAWVYADDLRPAIRGRLNLDQCHLLGVPGHVDWTDAVPARDRCLPSALWHAQSLQTEDVVRLLRRRRRVGGTATLTVIKALSLAPEGEPRERVLAVAEMAALFTAVNLDHLYTYLRNVGRHVQDIGRAFDRARDRAGLGKDVSPYTIRHTMATELRMRGVAVWDVAGWLGHSSGYKTTERYAKTNPEALAGAPRATDAYFADLAAAMEATRPVLSPTPVRASRVLPGQAEGAALQRSPLRKLVEPRRIELLTSTMPLLGRSSVDMRQDATI